MDSTFQSSPSDASTPGPLRLCGFCHKPFFEETAYNRHVSYCRRAQNRPRARARPCRACAKAKAKCSFQHQCQRCTLRSLECVYDTPASTAAAAAAAAAAADDARKTMRFVDEQAQPEESMLHRADPPSLAASEAPDSLDEMCVSGDTNEADPAHVNIDWENLNFGSSDMFLDCPKLHPLSTYQLDPAPRVLPKELPLSRGIRDIVGSPGGSSDSDNGLLITEIPGADQDPPAFLIPLPISDPISRFTANIVMQMLCAFPQMMLRRETFPPFIHGHWHCTSDAAKSALPEPLVNCMGLAQVFASHNPETRPFLWRTVREEQRSAAAKASQREFSKHDHLAAIQALLIYIMMRVVDNSSIKPDLNLELLVTYQGLCHSFKDLCNEPFYQHERLRPSSSWQEWVFAESRRRTAIVWLLVTQMLQIKIGVPCDTFASFRDVPLSSPRSLWEAKTRSEWESEYEVYRTMPRMGLDDFGDLYDACKHSNVASNKFKLHAWNATVDNLGVMLNLGAEIM